MFSAKVEGGERFRARLKAITSAPARSSALAEGAGVAAEAAAAVLDEEGWPGLEAEVRIEERGPVERDVVVEGRHLWVFEFGSGSRPGTGALSRALLTARDAVKRALGRGARRAIGAARRGT